MPERAIGWRSFRAKHPPTGRLLRAATLAAILGWFGLYSWRASVGHASLMTNAFDLSVFDYALWSLADGGTGFVPFMGESIFSQHFMPILAILVPAYAIFPHPMTLMLVQLLSVGTAAILFRVFQSRHGVDEWTATGLVLVFLLSRRTHSALAGWFYPEVLQAPLTFACVLLWKSRARFLWPFVVLLLMTKEDAAIYVAAFAGVAWVRRFGSRKRSMAVMLVSSAWLAAALLVAIPANRSREGLGPGNPILQARYGTTNGGLALLQPAERLASWRSAKTVANLLASAGFLSVAGGWWLLPAAPGLAANLGASPDSMQALLIGHYVWPLLPWIFMSASVGANWLQRRSARLARAFIAALLLATAIDSPALRGVVTTQVDSDASLVLDRIRGLSADSVLAQANLIPHLPKLMKIYAVGANVRPPQQPDLVLLTTVGNLWPVRSEQVLEMVDAYRRDPTYREVESGPLYAFRRVSR